MNGTSLAFPVADLQNHENTGFIATRNPQRFGLVNAMRVPIGLFMFIGPLMVRFNVRSAASRATENFLEVVYP
jgi:hypothetical protein